MTDFEKIMNLIEKLNRDELIRLEDHCLNLVSQRVSEVTVSTHQEEDCP